MPIPHDPKAERAVLGAILLRNDRFDEVAPLVGEDDFHVPGCRAAWVAVARLHDRKSPIDVITLEAELRRMDALTLVGGLEGIGKLSDAYATTHNVEEHARIVRRWAKVRILGTVAAEIAEESRATDVDPIAFVDSASQRLVEAIDHGRDVEAEQPLGEQIRATFAQILAVQRNDAPVVPIPLARVREVFDGGHLAGDLVVLGARPGMGKSAYAMDQALHAAVDCGIPTRFYSREMPATQLLMRAICSRSRVPLRLAKSGGLGELDYQHMVRIASEINAAPLEIDDRSRNITQILATARRWRRRTEPISRKCKGLGLVVVDYVQKYAGVAGKRYERRDLEIGDISGGLKDAAIDLRIPVLLLSQVSRDVDTRADKRPVIADLRECGRLEEDADAVVFLYRAHRYDDKADPHKADAIFAKQRNGDAGFRRTIRWLGAFTTFEDMPAES
jgi:replicative DNA helicase